MTITFKSDYLFSALTQRLAKTAKELGTLYLTHQSWKAHDGLFLQ